MRNAGLEEAQAEIKIAGKNINNLRYAQGVQESRVATREESGVLGFPWRRGLTPRGFLFGISLLFHVQF